MGTDEEHAFFNSPDSASFPSTVVQDNLVLTSSDGGLNWNMELDLSKTDARALEEMIWSSKGASKRVSAQKIRTLRVFSASDESSFRGGVGVETTNQTDFARQERVTMLREQPTMLRLNTNAVNSQLGNPNREFIFQMNPEHLRESREEDLSQAQLLDRMWGTSLTIFGLRQNLQQAFSNLRQDVLRSGITDQNVLREAYAVRTAAAAIQGVQMQAINEVISTQMFNSVLEALLDAPGPFGPPISGLADVPVRLDSSVLQDSVLDDDLSPIDLPSPVQISHTFSANRKDVFRVDFSALDTKKLTKAIKQADFPHFMLDNFLKRENARQGEKRPFYIAKGKCEERVLLGYLYCIQEGILALIVDSSNKNLTSHHPLCPNVGGKYQNIVWRVISEENIILMRSEPNERCFCLNKPYNLESMINVTASQLIALEVHQLPGKFAKKFGLPTFDNGFVLTKHVFSVEYNKIMQDFSHLQSVDIPSPVKIATALMEMATATIQEQGEEAAHEDIKGAQKSTLKLFRLNHAKKDPAGELGINMKTGWLGILAEKHPFVKHLKALIECAVTMPEAGSFFGDIDGITFFEPVNGEFVYSEDSGKPNTANQNAHIDTLGRPIEVNGKRFDLAYTAIFSLTDAPSTQITSTLDERDPLTILRTLGPSEFKKCFNGESGLASFSQRMAPLTLSILKTSTVHAGCQPGEDFCCPYTGSRNRIIFTFFFCRSEIASLAKHPALDVDCGFGAGIPDIDEYDLNPDVIEDLLEKSEDFKTQCEKIFGELESKKYAKQLRSEESKNLKSARKRKK
jgi:hypothetical protein